MIHFWMILSMLANHPKAEVLYNPLLDDKARQTRFIVSHQRPHALRPAASTVIIADTPTFNGRNVVDLPSVCSIC